VHAQRELVDVLEEHRQAVGRGDRRDERVEAGLERLVVQQARAEPGHRVDRELLEAAVEQALDAGAQRVRRGLRAGEREHLLGRGAALGRQPRMAVHERARLAGARGAQHEQRTAAVRDHGLLGRGEGTGRIGHVPRVCARRARMSSLGS
jgi:hypothetical protein